MSWFRNPLPLLAALLFVGSGTMAASKEDAAKKPAKSERKKDSKKDSKKDAPPPKPDAAPEKDAAPAKPSSGINVPVPPGHDAKGLVIPYRDESGKMQMRFTMEIGKRTDTDHMDMTKLLIETFDDDGKEEMTIDLPQSILDLNTRVISTQSGALIKRSDFELTGKTMEFNTQTKAGRLGGKVRMLIYNLENETNSKPEERAREK